MNAIHMLPGAIAVFTAGFAAVGLLLAWLAASAGAPSMRQSVRVTLRIVTGRGRRSVNISTARTVAPPMSLNSTRPVFIHPHILRPPSEGTPLISLGFERWARRHLAAANRREAA